MKLDYNKFYSGYRHNLEGQKKLCTQLFVQHFWDEKKKEEEEIDISKKNKTRN